MWIYIIGVWNGIGLALGFFIGREAYKDKEKFWTIVGVFSLIWIGWFILVPWALIDFKIEKQRKEAKNKRELLSYAVRLRRRWRKWFNKFRYV